jgi:epoxyqueuosine reductase
MSGKPRFIQLLEKKGYYSSVVSIDHLEELGAEIRSLHDAALLNDDFFNEYASPYFTPRLPRDFPDAKSIIVVATPQSALRTTFNWKGQVVRFIVPPTYYDEQKVTSRARRLLKEAFEPESHRFVRAVLPIKLLAVRSGLAFYGRNNITYVPSIGSFHRLTAFYSDYDSPVDYWQEKRALPACGKCRACLTACPTGAISSDKFLIRVEKCLTYLNEKNSKHGFPGWVNPAAHNCLVGCLRCQMACPYDKGLIENYEDRGTFSGAETAYLLKGKFSGAKSKAMNEKLKRVGLDITLFPRNLEVLLAQKSK